MPAQTVSDVTYTPDDVFELLSAADAVLFSAPLLLDGTEEPVKRNTQPIQAEGSDAQGHAGAGEVRLGRWTYPLVLSGALGTQLVSLLTALDTAAKARVGSTVILLSDGGQVEERVPISATQTRVTISVIPSQHLSEGGSEIGLL